MFSFALGTWLILAAVLILAGWFFVLYRMQKAMYLHLLRNAEWIDYEAGRNRNFYSRFDLREALWGVFEGSSLNVEAAYAVQRDFQELRDARATADEEDWQLNPPY